MRKISPIGSAVVGVLLICSPGFAADHLFMVGGEILDYGYEEPDFMENEGTFYGLVGRYEYHHNGKTAAFANITYGLETRISHGKVDYTSQGTGSINGIDDYVFELRGEVGYEIPLGKGWQCTPFFGVGYRYLNDDAGGRLSSTGAMGYERQSRYHYSPVGILLGWKIGKGWSVGLQVEYDYFWYGTQKSLLHQVDANAQDIENDQHSGYGAQVMVKIRKKLGKMALRVEPFYRRWDIDDSEVVYFWQENQLYAALEPANRTTEIGARVLWEF